MGRLLFAILIVTALFFQATIWQEVGPLAVLPDLVMVLLLVWSAMRGVPEGLFWAFGLGLLIDVARRMSRGDRFVRAGGWLKGGLEFGTSLKDKKVGIVGLGRIGRATAKRAEAFGLEVLYHGRRQQAGVSYPFYTDLVQLARDSDFLVLTLPGGPETKGMVSAEVLDALGSEGMLVNVARGSIVDEKALVSALQTGKLGGAALDVFADEPRVPPELLTMDNVVLQPHVGSATHDTRAAMGKLVVDNLLAHFAGQPLVTRVA